MVTIKFLDHFPGHTIFVSMIEDSSRPPIHYHNGYSDKLASKLTNANDDKHHGIFFAVNLLDETLDPGRHRTKKMVTHARAVFMDADDPVDAPLNDFPLKPSIVVNTSPGKYHYYWLIDEPTDDLETWNLVQRGLINKYNGDDNAKDLTRYLRLPGYNHCKNEPYLVTWEGDGNTYSWGELVEAFPPSSEAKPVKDGEAGNLAELSAQQSVAELDAVIETAGHGLHQALNKRLLGMKRDGYMLGDAIDLMQMKGNKVPEAERDDRWRNRFSVEQLTRSFNGAPEDIIDLPDIVDKIHESRDMPWPPGLMGELADAALAAANYPRNEIAVVTAIAVVSGVAGRKFNINGTGLNTYQTLIAKTGSGKDAIPNFINQIFTACNEIGTGMSFLGSGGFTGKKSVANKLVECPSQINIISEAGLLMQSTSGDQEGLTATILNAYGRSGHGQSLLGSSYSKQEDNIPNIISPALSIISESTPETLIQVLHDKGAMENGSIARQAIFRIFGKRPDINFNAKNATISDEVLDRMKGLMSACMNAQKDHKASYDVWNIEFGEYKDRIHAFGKFCNDKHNDLLDIDFNRSIMYSRAFVKYLKYVGHVVAFNTKELVVTEEAMDWAELMIDYEMDGLQAFFEGGATGLFDELVRSIVGPAIVKVINGKADKSISQSSLDQRKKGIFPLNGPKQVLKNNTQLAKLSNVNGFKATDGYIKIIDYMITYGFLVDVSTPGKKLMKATDDFKAMLYD